jgi:predicted aspartyl protease
MIFRYRSTVCEAPDGDGFIEILRPVVTITVSGPEKSASCIGLVDTGSDHTILPKSMADELGITVRPASGTPASAFGGHQVRLLFGEARLSLVGSDETVSWIATVFVYDFPNPGDEIAILGHTGFLDYFTAIFDGKLGTLTLLPNDELPVAE